MVWGLHRGFSGRVILVSRFQGGSHRNVVAVISCPRGGALPGRVPRQLPALPPLLETAGASQTEHLAGRLAVLEMLG